MRISQRFTVAAYTTASLVSLVATAVAAISSAYGNPPTIPVWGWIAIGYLSLAGVAGFLLHGLYRENRYLRARPLVERQLIWVQECLAAWRSMQWGQQYPAWEGGLRGAGGCIHELEHSFADEIGHLLGGTWAARLRDVTTVPLGPPEQGVHAETGLPHKLRQAEQVLGDLLSQSAPSRS